MITVDWKGTGKGGSKTQTDRQTDKDTDRQTKRQTETGNGRARVTVAVITISK